MPYKDPQARREYQRRYREIQKDKNRQYAKKPRGLQRLRDLNTRSSKDDETLRQVGSKEEDKG